MFARVRKSAASISTFVLALGICSTTAFAYAQSSTVFIPPPLPSATPLPKAKPTPVPEPAAQAQYLTASGAVYKLVANMPEHLNPAYQDSTGLIWGPALRAKSGNLIKMSHQDAAAICSELKVGGVPARLPKLKELVRLRESMSRQADPNSEADVLSPLAENFSANATFDFKKPAFPSALVSMWGEEVSIRNPDFAVQYRGETSQGTINFSQRDDIFCPSIGCFFHGHPVVCVIDPSQKNP